MYRFKNELTDNNVICECQHIICDRPLTGAAVLVLAGVAQGVARPSEHIHDRFSKPRKREIVTKCADQRLHKDMWTALLLII